jgi:hypothetical protein
MQSVSDIRSNENDQIVYAVKKLGKSKLKREVFEAVYFGKTKVKTVDNIAKATNHSRKTILDTAKKLVTAKLIHQQPGWHNGDTSYIKDEGYKGIWQRILKVKNPNTIPTKVQPSIKSVKQTIILKIPKDRAKIQPITIDDISSFSKVKKMKANPSLANIPEARFKKGLMKILDETKSPPKDWGGEKNDVFTTNLKIGGKRYHAAFALKGPGKKIKNLTPKHMGKNGDQIQRLHRSSAQVYFVQYWKDIDQSIVELMEQLALAKSFSENREIFFGIIDGADSSRLIQAYSKSFKK